MVFLHGVPGSRRYWAFAGPRDPASEKAVRLIAPDRPGIGRSSAAHDRGVLDFADDLAALADRLGIERFALVGFSGGCAYALATAARMPAMVASVVLVAPVADLARPRLLSGLDPLTRKGLSFLAGTTRHRLELPRRLDHGRTLTSAVSKMWSLLPASDRRVLSLPHVKIATSRMLEEAALNGLDGVRLDAEIMTRAWEFELADVGAPVTIHAGTADPWSTHEMVHWLKLGLPECRVRWHAGAGHFAALALHASEVLGDAIEPRASRVAPVPAMATGT